MSRGSLWQEKNGLYQDYGLFGILRENEIGLIRCISPSIFEILLNFKGCFHLVERKGRIFTNLNDLLIILTRRKSYTSIKFDRIIRIFTLYD